MKKVGVVIIAIACVALVCGGFYFATRKNQPSHEEGTTVSEVQKIILKDIEQAYPNTPREVVKLYNRIVKCYYSGEYTEEEFGKLADQGLLLFDAELAAVNPKDQYMSAVKSDVASYKKEKKSLSNTGVCASNDVLYAKDGDDNIAYVTASYFVQKDSKFNKTFQQYVLRKDSVGRWKILCFYKIKGDSSADGN